MSEVYIRSQNKEKLYRLGGNYACVEYGEYEDIKKKRGGAEADKKRHVICISDGCLEEIGEYATKERLRIIEGKAEAYVGYLAAFKPFADHEISEEYRKYSGHEVKKFRAVPEITHKRWKELGLMKPLEPDQTAQYKFSDLQMSLYYTIYI